MKIENFKKSPQLPVICSFNITFEKMGMTIRDCRLMLSAGKRWVALPCKRYEDKEGKTKYFNFVTFHPEIKSSFEEKVLELLEPFLSKSVHNEQLEF